MRRDSSKKVLLEDDLFPGDENSYFTYRPLSNLPTPPPTSKEPQLSLTPLDDGEALLPKFRGPAIHLVNMIPSSASLATASIPLVQGILSRANLPIETVALAVCILDSLDAKFARTWRLSCPLLSATLSPSSKRHTLPPTPVSFAAAYSSSRQQLHIDSVSPELIVLSALVIAAKFTEDPQESSQHYCGSWGRGLWSADQLNVTERCIMESLGYRIMPLCDEGYLADAMVDMQLAGRQHDWHLRQPSPPESVAPELEDDCGYVPSHSRSKTMAAVGVGMYPTPLDTPACEASQLSTPRAG